MTVKKEGPKSPSRTTQMLDVLQNSPMLRQLAETAGLVDESTAPSIRPEVGEAITELKGAGIAVKKHGRDGGVRPRLLGINDEETQLTWKDPRGSRLNVFRRNDLKAIELKDVTAVRSGTDLDPETVGLAKRPLGMTGTPVLRRSAEGNVVAKKAFSLILSDRTIDIECNDSEQNSVLYAAFDLLVAKAKNPDALQKLQELSNNTNTPAKANNNNATPATTPAE